MATVNVSNYTNNQSGFNQAVSAAGSGGTVLIDRDQNVDSVRVGNVTLAGVGTVQADKSLSRVGKLVCQSNASRFIETTGNSLKLVGGLTIDGNNKGARLVQIEHQNCQILDADIVNATIGNGQNAGIVLANDTFAGFRCKRTLIKKIRNDSTGDGGRARGVWMTSSDSSQVLPNDVKIYNLTIEDVFSGNQDVEENSIGFATTKDSDAVVVQGYSSSQTGERVIIHGLTIINCGKRGVKWQSPGLSVRAIRMETDDVDQFRCFAENTRGSSDIVFENAVLKLIAADNSFSAMMHNNGAGKTMSRVNFRGIAVDCVDQLGESSGSVIEIRANGLNNSNSQFGDIHVWGRFKVGEVIRDQAGTGTPPGLGQITYHDAPNTARQFK